MHRSCATGERSDRKTARIAEAIEHIAIPGERPHARTVVALIEKEARFLSERDVDPIGKRILEEAERRMQRAEECACAAREPFERAHVGIGSLVYGRAPGGFANRSYERVAPSLRTRGKDLHDRRIGVAVDDETRQAVGFTVDEAA